MSVLGNWEQWKEFLGDRLRQAEQSGMTENVITDVAHQVGDYLSEQVDPKNEQQRVLSELWKVADEQEQQAIANMMVKLVKNQH
ncbi:MAG TPA: DUF3243 domain-containing protein [Bacilli bacterium]|nr:DUF3243 domain-containing protein [Bacilli bacterium]